MHFELTQRFDASVPDVAEAFCDPGFYGVLAELPNLGRPDVLSRTVEGARVKLAVRYRFAGDLSSAAKAVLDPAKLTWVEQSVHDLDSHEVTFVQVPDHYADRFSCSGRYSFRADGAGTVRDAEGDVKVRALLVGSSVERAIISGLKDHLDEEADLLERWLTGEV